MTYRQYYIKLIKDIEKLEKFNEDQYQKAKDQSDFLDKEQIEHQTRLQNELYSTMHKCEIVADLISTKQVKSTDIIDPDVLGFFPTDLD